MAKHSAPESGRPEPRRALAWLSRSLTSLFDGRDRAYRRKGRNSPPPPPRFDVLIVGSGYGGAVAAASLAGSRLKPQNGGRGRRLRIAMLERGHEYLPGAFPSRLSELPGHVRFSTPDATSPRGVRTGLFDVRIGADIVAVVANGLGGGSLINAGVMLRPPDGVLAETCWPSEISSNPGVLKPYYDTVMQWLGAGTPKAPNTVERANVRPPKFHVMQARAGKTGIGVPITVALTPGVTSSGGVAMSACLACGDCATGCNHGAKNSLDVNLLVHAHRKRLQIYTGATVLRLEKIASGWSVVVNHTNPALRQRQTEPLRIEADKVILAAGTFGSTEILMRSRSRSHLPLSSLLGRRFSGNGDLFAAAYDMPDRVNAVATESQSPARRKVGPTITATIRETNPSDDFNIQELAVPGPLRRLFEEAFTTARTLHSLGQRDGTRHTADAPDPNAVDAAAIRHTLPIALIGRDDAGGEIVPVPAQKAAVADEEGDGAVYVQWPGASNDPRFDARQRRAERVLIRPGSSSRLLPNPLWKLLPDREAQTLGIARGPLLTVHPLGGCPMGNDARMGVVNHLGQVFRVDRALPTAVYSDLVVLDGAIVPTSLGVNPALTIAALALRAIETLSDARHWDLSIVRLGDVRRQRMTTKPLVRPIFRTLPPPVKPKPTEVQLMERLGGNAILADGQRHHLELTLHSQPVVLSHLMSPTGRLRRIDYDPGASALRIFSDEPSSIEDDPVGSPPSCHQKPCFEARAKVVSGSLEIMQLAPTRWLDRVWCALPAWLMHRGLRDCLQGLVEKFSGMTRLAPSGLLRQLKDAEAIATRAGAKRTLDYTLWLSDFQVAPGQSPTTFFGKAATPNAVLEACGRKTLTYNGRSSPWQQLMELQLHKFPGQPHGNEATLSLDLAYLARQGVALLRVVSQQDHVHALVDLASFQLYMLRTLLDGHAWSFRRPDRVPARAINRLPGVVPGLPPPEAIELKVAEVEHQPVHLRLTRYRPFSPRAGQPPVLLIHGYSASGTTFVHPTLRPGLGGRLVQKGHDVWVLDLRSSAGMPERWATYPWTFEQIAYEDIPLAVRHVVGVCGGGKIDVVAHCMGSAMLCMALLGDIPNLELGDLMRNRIRRIVLSQVGPLVVMSPANQARAFLMRYVRQLIPMGEYRFRPEGDGSMADMLLDRLLATLPYPPEEFRIENPRRFWVNSPWVQTRRRMDLLYGQVFKLANMSRETLDHLDDFFGAMSVETVSQVIHFARTRAITDVHGRHVFATRERLRRLRDYRIMSIHGAKNGLVDVSTADLLEKELRGDGYDYRAKRFDGFGHQDCLIGKNALEILDEIVAFLDEPGRARTPAPARRSPRPQQTRLPAQVVG